ncbi:MAG: replicative DNA helicase [Gammaproteobacteria bacterium]
MSARGGDVRTPPHSIEAEQAVLGGLLLDARAWDDVADMLSDVDFYRPDHRLIFEAIGLVAAGGKPADAVTVSGQLERNGKLADAGGLAYLGALVRDTPTAANVRAYASIVRERSLLRQLLQAGADIAASVFNNEGETARDLVEMAESKVFAIAEQGAGGKRDGALSVQSLMPALIDQIDEWHNNPNGLRGLPTGFDEFDRKTGGLRPGDLVVVAGRPSMGKTTFAVNMAEYAALKGDVKASVAIFSMEMPSEQLMTRMLSSVGRVSLGDIRSGRIGDDDWPRITGAAGQLSEAKIFIDETPALTPTQLRARARRVHREHGLGLVVVDYLQLMQVPGNKENRATEIAEISRSLKALAKELRVPVIALSQLNRGVEQRVDKKPVMSDLRECVPGDTLVCLTDGSRVPIRELVGRQPEVWALDERRRLIAAKSDLVWSVGMRALRRVHLASGRSLRATGAHRVLTGAGWKTLDELAPGDRMALAHRLPGPTATAEDAPAADWPDHALVLLGHLVGDGSYLKGQPMRYTTASQANSDAVRAAAEAFGCTVSRHEGRGNWHQLVISGNGDRWHPAGVGAWLRGLGIFGQRSHEKHLPPSVFRLPDERLALLLRHLWATDGCISLRGAGSRGASRIYFSTCSRLLADDVAALLLRFGIVARLRTTNPSKGRPVHSVDVSGARDQLQFLDAIGAFGPREAPALALRERLRSIVANSNVDTLPAEVMAETRAEMRRQGVTTRAMAAMRGTSYGGGSHFAFAPSRETLADYARLLDSEALRAHVDADVFWDRVVAVDPPGEELEEVFDLTVPGPANWLADGIVSHNSGAIEQDADMILLIYREEVYDKNTTKKGMAEIDLAKHRNGETGTFVLTFQGQYSRFVNYAPDSYAEGVLR